MPRLEIGDLHVTYGNAIAVDGVSLTVPGGSVTCLVGPNGAGKSSVLLAVYGSVVSSGSIELDGQQVNDDTATQRARAGLAIVPQGRQLFPRLTVRENLQVYADMLRVDRSRLDAALDRFPILRTRASSLAGVLSGGEQQMLVVARALMAEPKALLLDETMTGLAPRIVDELVGVVADLRDSGIAILMAEPSIHAVRRVIDRGHVMLRGAFVDSTEDGGAELDHLYQASMGLEVV